VLLGSFEQLGAVAEPLHQAVHAGVCDQLGELQSALDERLCPQIGPVVA
jgi:hypothetical protein